MHARNQVPGREGGMEQGKQVAGGRQACQMMRAYQCSEVRGIRVCLLRKCRLCA